MLQAGLKVVGYRLLAINLLECTDLPEVRIAQDKCQANVLGLLYYYAGDYNYHVLYVSSVHDYMYPWVIGLIPATKEGLIEGLTAL